MRVVGVRAFVHFEHDRDKLHDLAWKGQPGLPYYNSCTRQVVETRNVTFIEKTDAHLPSLPRPTVMNHPSLHLSASLFLTLARI